MLIKVISAHWDVDKSKKATPLDGKGGYISMKKKEIDSLHPRKVLQDQENQQATLPQQIENKGFQSQAKTFDEKGQGSFYTQTYTAKLATTK